MDKYSEDIQNLFPDSDREEINAALAAMVKRGLVEQYIDENGEFVFALTEKGDRIANDLKSKDDDKGDS